MIKLILGFIGGSIITFIIEEIKYAKEIKEE